jgi:hypothetical protein
MSTPAVLYGFLVQNVTAGTKNKDEIFKIKCHLYQNYNAYTLDRFDPCERNHRVRVVGEEVGHAVYHAVDKVGDARGYAENPHDLQEPVLALDHFGQAVHGAVTSNVQNRLFHYMPSRFLILGKGFLTW